MDIRFDNKTALVTGAGRGIGKRIVERLCELGAKVIAVSKSQANLDALKQQLPAITTVSVDLSNWTETQEKLKPLVGEVDLLVNNAASSGSQRVGEVTEDAIDTMFNVNYKACVNLTQLVAEGMKKRKSGSIVNLSSIAGLDGWERHCVYGSTKSALDMLTKVSTRELGQYNIRVNSVNPTVVWTEMGQMFWSEPAKKETVLQKIPLGRFVEVDEVVDPVLFLLSDRAAMINGVLLPIDGGVTATR